MRMRAIQQNWPMRPDYSLLNYQEHYFHTDFPYLALRFSESHEEAEKSRREQKRHAPSNRNFIPSKVAFRIRDCISFTLKV